MARRARSCTLNFPTGEAMERVDGATYSVMAAISLRDLCILLWLMTCV